MSGEEGAALIGALVGALTRADFAGPVAALVAGLVTGLHCVGMCGPLACAACAAPCARTGAAAGGVYNLARVAAYGVAGTVAGWVGKPAAQALAAEGGRVMCWVFALFFLAVVFGLDKRLRLPMPSRWLGRLLRGTAGAGRDAGAGGGAARGVGAGAGVWRRALVLGLCTPFLPCAPLYLAVAGAAMAGSALNGAVVMMAFGLGTVPLLWAAQKGMAAWERRFSPVVFEGVRRGLALVSVVLLVMRAGYAPETGCPMCH